MRAHEFIIMPQSIKPLGLIHKPGTGPNNRFGFKNVGNNRANENFADGKKKGKSRPGRVKKSGASCNGSVTSLRAKAKKASGEKAKMYHWCANMSSETCQMVASRWEDIIIQIMLTMEILHRDTLVILVTSQQMNLEQQNSR